ncbi:Putative oxoglutarate/iron-dependent dioxygenase, non-hem dioxygenase domain-containing protein [Colletotrichum destructivum]|uniref:Oxoglutarate/iron-dependent dioxygenase, non-hem dioxygenase domain-containing protein n=1 Tax=Colletotrichum destructivum TaxID=34406 RepID=A0AAX4J3S3_9PEZI|nr:Putative oxoglutarate/iron-dependent dioxygenase, non-hem dioxygenase domain-containing protein [Colletotrichum destructivum]
MAITGIKSRKHPRSVDLTIFTTGDQSQRRQVACELVQSIHETGFCRLPKHNISIDTLDRVFGQCDKFFKLPVAVKSKIKHPPQHNPHRIQQGWSEVGRETVSTITDHEKGAMPVTDKPAVLDIKEAFDMGNPHDPLFENMWLPEEDLPGFKDDMERFYDECRREHLILLEALELGCSALLGFNPDFRRFCQDSVSECRINYYPATKASLLRPPGGHCNRISPHSDFGTLTLLFQDGVGGLEIEDQSDLGQFFPVTCDSPHELLVNAGDVLQRWSNNYFRSVNHLVTLPPALKKDDGEGDRDEFVPERTSVAFFAKADREAKVGSLPGFENGEHRYEQMTSLQYNQMKLKLTYGFESPAQV